MKKEKLKLLDVEIDKLTNSIENTITGEVFDTEVVRVSKEDITVVKKLEWLFDWSKEIIDPKKTVYKLTTVNNPKIIQGLVSVIDRKDHIYTNLIESADFNKGRNKTYAGVPANLVAFACKVSFEKGYEGLLAFDAKTILIRHYEETLHATHFKGTKMFI